MVERENVTLNRKYRGEKYSTLSHNVTKTMFCNKNYKQL